MNLVDSSGWLEYFVDGKCAPTFAPILRDLNQVLVSTINIFEVHRKILADAGRDAALQAAGMMQQATVAEVTGAIAVHAAELSVQRKLPMADSLIYVTALQHNATLWTLDSVFAGLQNVRLIRKQ